MRAPSPQSPFRSLRPTARLLVLLAGPALLANNAHVSSVSAADVVVRAVAADRPTRPPVGDLVDFRRSPDGGLVAVQWASGLTLAGKPLFPVENDDPATKVASDPSLVPGKKTGRETDDLLNELAAPKSRRVVRPVDVVDPQYVGRTLSDGRKVGPVRHRPCETIVPDTRTGAITPGTAALAPGAKTVDIPCLPVTFTAVRGGERTTFVPQLAYAGRDLLADALFEHSPDLPFGDDSGAAAKGSTGYQAWLDGTRGGARDFRRLTLYLPTLPQEPYRIHGIPFRVGNAGVVLGEANTASVVRVEQRGPFHLELVLPVPASRTTDVPLLLGLRGDWQGPDAAALAFDPVRHAFEPLALKSAANGPLVLLPRAPARADAPSKTTPAQGAGAANKTTPAHEPVRFVCLVSRDDPPAAPVVRVVESAASHEATPGRLTLRLVETEAAGRVRDLPDELRGDLLPSSALRTTDSDESRSTPAERDAQPVSVVFAKSAPETWTADVARLAPGGYGLRFSGDPANLTRVPVVVAGPHTTAAISLSTYHNRGDYLRGERIDVRVALRGTRAVAETAFEIIARTDEGHERVVGRLSAAVVPTRTTVRFVPLDTTLWEPGRVRLDVRPAASSSSTADAFLAYGTDVEVHPREPRTTFALHAWMTGSFSGPIAQGLRPLVNLCLGQKPSAHLAPGPLRHLERQPAFAQVLRPAFARDPLLPDPHTTDRYDAETEREIAVAMRLGLRYAPDYGWGMNGQEAAWNPKHTLPEELDRIRRLCLQVAQRHRDFGNFAGLHLNWYPRAGGYWENHPATDGNVVPRRERLEAEVKEIYAETDDDRARPDGGFVRGVRAHRYRVGALSRAYDAWTEGVRRLPVGAGNEVAPIDLAAKAIPFPDLRQPGLTGEPAFSSFLPISWFSQRNYYPSAYFDRLPVATVHAYTDYGFSPFQPLWGLDHWAAGLGTKPKWVTTMSNGRDVMLAQAMLCCGRGASGIDLDGQDPAASAVIADFLAAYGPFFRTLEPRSEVAVITSLRQQFSSPKLAGQWMGYTGGTYFDLYTKLWYARRPPEMLAEEDVTAERLRRFRAVFLVGQQAPLPDGAKQALDDWVRAGGRIFKDAETADDFPGERFAWDAGDGSGAPAGRWDPARYKETRDRFFVGTQAGFERVAPSVDKLLGTLPAPHVRAADHSVLLAVLQPAPAVHGEAQPSSGSKPSSAPKTDDAAPRVVSVVFAANDRHPPPGIEHPWNFWSATILSQRTSLDFDRPVVLYDLLAGGREIRLDRTPAVQGRYVVPVSFERGSGRAFLATNVPVAGIRLTTARESAGGPVPVSAEIFAEDGRAFRDPFPCSVSLVDARGRVVQTVSRALGPGRTLEVPLPAVAAPESWTIRVQELASGRTASAAIRLVPRALPESVGDPVLVTRPAEVAAFLVHRHSPRKSDPLAAAAPNSAPAPAATPAPKNAPAADALPDDAVLILLDARQVADKNDPLVAQAERLKDGLRAAGRTAEVRIVGEEDVIEVPLRWRPTSRDTHWFDEVRSGRRIVAAASLNSVHDRLPTGAAGALDVLHPHCGWLEPGARHRVDRDAIVLGSAQRNRFVEDLHATVGLRGADLVSGSDGAVVQVVHDAFVPHRDCLSLQGDDAAALERAVSRVLTIWKTAHATKEAAPESAEPAPAATPQTIEGRERGALPDPLGDGFGATVQPVAFLPDGGVFAWASTTAASHFEFDADGKLVRKWLGKYAVERDEAEGSVGPAATRAPGLWLRQWWGVPGFVDTLVRADRDARPLWRMQLPNTDRGYQGWRHPGRGTWPEPHSGDLFVAGGGRLSRITPEGRVLWQYDDLDTAADVESFRFAREIMLHGVSRDGRFVLAAAFGIEPYSRFVSRFLRPTVLLFDAQTGRIAWRKDGVLIDHSACGFVSDDRIVLADATAGRKRTLLVDLTGRETWSTFRPEGTSAASLSPDGRWLVVRPEAPRGANFQTLGPPQGLAAIRLPDSAAEAAQGAGAANGSGTPGEVRAFPLTGEVHAWKTNPVDGSVLVSTDDGALRCFGPDASPKWSKQFAGPVSLLVAPDGKRIAVGTQSGLLLLLDAQGEEQRRIDLMPFDVVEDEAQYVRDYTASPASVPVRDPVPTLPPRIDVRGGGSVKFSENLLAGVPEADPQGPGQAAVERTWRTPRVAAPGTHVLSVTQRTAGGRPPAKGERLVVEVRQEGTAEPLLRTETPPTSAWEERTFAWRGTGSGPLTVVVRSTGGPEGAAGLEVRNVGLFSVAFPSSNLLAQRLPDAPGSKGPAGGGDDLDALLDGGGTAGGAKIVPPTVHFVLPNDVDLTAKSRGAPPFKPVVPFTVPFDGRLSGQPTSWLNKPASGSSHARLELTFAAPAKMGSLALYEDPAAPYAGEFAVFVREAESKQWKQVGRGTGNGSQFHLFSFAPITTDAVTYLWLSSPDGHVRLAEMEGYRAK